MSNSTSDFGAAWWSQNLNEVDEEVARLASICDVKLFEPGVVERVLANDSSVCGTTNALAFGKLRNALLMHYAVRSRAAQSIGQAQAQAVVDKTVEDLKEKFGERLGTPTKR